MVAVGEEFELANRTLEEGRRVGMACAPGRTE
jgi:hypothetical protein